MFVWCIDSAFSQNLLFSLLVVVGSTIHSIVYVHMTVGECQLHGSSVVAIPLSRLCIVKKTSCLVYYTLSDVRVGQLIYRLITAFLA